MLPAGAHTSRSTALTHTAKHRLVPGAEEPHAASVSRGSHELCKGQNRLHRRVGVCVSPGGREAFLGPDGARSGGGNSSSRGTEVGSSLTWDEPRRWRWRGDGWRGGRRVGCARWRELWI